MIRAATLLALAFIGMAAAWTSNGYYDRYGVAPMRADQDGYGFGSLFEANRRQFQNSRMNTSGEYTRGYRNGGMDYYPSSDYYGYGGYRNYNDYDYGYGSYGNGRMLQRYRPNRYMGSGGYDYGYNGRYHWDNRDYTSGSYDYNYNNRYGRGYNNRYYNNNDYWSYSQTPRSYSQGGYGPNYDSYRYY